MQDSQRTVLLIGGTDAGKSNFLFRLWLAIDEGKGLLSKNGLPPQLEYLRQGAEKLLEGEFAGHTSKEVYERVSVPLRRSGALGETGTLVVPDVPGEQILAICRNRHWSHSWEELISNRCACLLFIRAGSDDVIAPLDWAACHEKYGGVIEAPPEEKSAESRTGHGLSQSAPANKERADETLELPTQVVLTEWLQFLRKAFVERAGGGFRPRIGVVVAAWDAVPKEQQAMGPTEYIEDNFPLLAQYINANDDQFDFQTFGLSIVGGDLKNDREFKAKYLNERLGDFGGIVHSFSGVWEHTGDITCPVAWALRFI